MKNADADAEKCIIFFDGVCNLCNEWVDFLIDRSKTQNFYYSSLQGQTARRLLGQEKAEALSSVVLWKQGQVYERSTAVLQTLGMLGGGWKVFSLLGIFPQSLRDRVYEWVANHRYAWFGKRETCRLPTPEEKAFFLD